MTMLSDDAVTQGRFAELIGISQPAVSDLLKRGVLSRDATATTWLLEYCTNLREQAAGRQADGGLNLATERARLSRAQADIAELNLRERRGELVPIAGLEHKLKAAVIAAREYLLQQPPRLSMLLDGLDRAAREELLVKAFEEFLHRIADMNGAPRNEPDDDIE